ncbi:MAG: quercetin dioxygenase-like cupin family protein [Methanobacteriota archaeon]|jgi:quercetin dioxygenase-like cupin family protein|uniref:Cupin domain-containing protein n=1 Tax=Halorutilus salinus TaxID=2487751 RepID=A0A9Q4C682_9EURY|nr:cupin domain-containing protein [Halorutilus salinus]MCX2819704.1 cupin domain-containing protein [Halorutilus salinus]
MVERKTVGDGDAVVDRLFDVPQTLRLKLSEGYERPEHQHPGKEITLFVHQGALSLLLGDQRHRVEEGDAIRFSGDQDISPRAIEDTVAVLVFVDA